MDQHVYHHHDEDDHEGEHHHADVVEVEVDVVVHHDRKVSRSAYSVCLLFCLLFVSHYCPIDAKRRQMRDSSIS